MPKDRFTRKQCQIMEVVINGISSEPFVAVDFNWLLDKLPYVTSKESMQFSLRRLVMNGFIKIDYEKRGNRVRKVIYPTESGKEMLKRMK